MAVDVLAQGKVIRLPEPRKARNGNTYALVLLSCATEEGDALVSVIAFASEAVEKLLSLRQGDSVCVAGRGRLTSWADRTGAERHGLSVTAEAVLTVYEARRKRAAMAEPGEDDAGPATPRRARPAEKPATAARLRPAQAAAAVALQSTGGGVADLTDDLDPWAR